MQTDALAHMTTTTSRQPRRLLRTAHGKLDPTDITDAANAAMGAILLAVLGRAAATLDTTGPAFTTKVRNTHRGRTTRTLNLSTATPLPTATYRLMLWIRGGSRSAYYSWLLVE
jgi:hypothetical protein